MCFEWEASFAAFLKDMGPRPSAEYTLERKDNSKGYSKENCYWATKAAQARNRRTTKLTIDAAREIRALRAAGVGCGTLAKRYKINVSTVKDICRNKIWIDEPKHSNIP